MPACTSHVSQPPSVCLLPPTGFTQLSQLSQDLGLLFPSRTILMIIICKWLTKASLKWETRRWLSKQYGQGIQKGLRGPEGRSCNPTVPLQGQQMLGILLCFSVLFYLSPSFVSPLSSAWEGEGQGLGRQERCFIGQKLAWPHHTSSVCLTQSLETGLHLLAPPRPYKFMLFNFYRGVYGLQRRRAGGCVVRGCTEQWNIFLMFFFLFFHSVFLVNEHLDPLREMGKDSLGAKHERAEGSWRGLQENPRHGLSLINLLIWAAEEHLADHLPTLNYTTY